jgi:hypothetical protein
MEPRTFYVRERVPDTHSIGGWVGPKTGPNDVKKKKILSLPNSKPSAFQAVPSRFTDDSNQADICGKFEV